MIEYNRLPHALITASSRGRIRSNLDQITYLQSITFRQKNSSHIEVNITRTMLPKHLSI